MKTVVTLVLMLSLFLLAGDSALAGRQWYFQRVATPEMQPLTHGSTAVGMRSGHTWPVVVGNEGTAAMVPGGWIATDSGMPSTLSPGFIDGVTSHSGQKMLFAGNNGHIKTFGPSGWSNTFVASEGYRNSAAFTRNDNPAVLYRSVGNGDIRLAVSQNGQWSNESLGLMADGYALAYDSLNQANVILRQGVNLLYGTKGVLTNNEWSFSSIGGITAYSPLVDLELTAGDVPYAIYANQSGLVYNTYNIMQGRWESGIIDSQTRDLFNFTAASDGQGGIGVAYYTHALNGLALGYAYTNGDGFWDISLLPTGIPNDVEFTFRTDYGIGLAFDAQNNPVISFSGAGGSWIAYDPVLVPEPATAMLLLLGGSLLRRRRKG